MPRRVWRRQQQQQQKDSATAAASFHDDSNPSACNPFQTTMDLHVNNNSNHSNNGGSAAGGGGQQATNHHHHNHHHHHRHHHHSHRSGSGNNIPAQVVPYLTPENVAAVPPPGLTGPSQATFAPHCSRYLAYIANVPKPPKNKSSSSSQKSSVARSSTYRPLTAAAPPSATGQQKPPLRNGTAPWSSAASAGSGSNSSTTSSSKSSSSSTERVLMVLDVLGGRRNNKRGNNSNASNEDSAAAVREPRALLQWGSGRRSSSSFNNNKRRAVDASSPASSGSQSLSLEERLRRERQRISSAAGSLTQFSWVRLPRNNSNSDDDDDNNNKNGTVENDDDNEETAHNFRLLIPARGSLYIQDGFVVDDGDGNDDDEGVSLQQQQQQQAPRQEVKCTCIHDKSATGLSAMDAVLSPDGSMVAWAADGELYVQAAVHNYDSSEQQQSHHQTTTPAIQISFGAVQNETQCVTNGVADFVAQEEMDRYRGFWWHPDSNAILFCQNDETDVPVYRIMHYNHHSSASSSPMSDNSSSQHEGSSHGGFGSSPTTPKSSTTSMYEDHRYPFAGKLNPAVRLGFVQIDRESIVNQTSVNSSPRKVPPSPSSVTMESRDEETGSSTTIDDPMQVLTAQEIASENWSTCLWLDPPREANEYLARVHWIPDGCAVVQWQNRAQTCSVLCRIDLRQKNNANPDGEDKRPGRGKSRALLVERTNVWINLHHMFHVLPTPIHPDECCWDTPTPPPPSQQQQQQPQSQEQQHRIIPMPNPLPEGSFSFLFASERTGYSHLYLYTYCPGINGEQAVLLKTVTEGDWMVESILGVDMEKDVVYFTGTFDSVLQRHLYATPLLGKSNQHTWRMGASATATAATMVNEEADPRTGTAPPHATLSSVSEDSLGSHSHHGGIHVGAAGHNGGVRRSLSKVMNALSGKGGRHFRSSNGEHRDQPVEIPLATKTENRIGPTRLTSESGMHSIVMDEKCRSFVDTSSDLGRPTTVKIYELPTDDRLTVRRVMTLFDAVHDDTSTAGIQIASKKKSKGNTRDLVQCLPAPELLQFPTSDGTETLHAALYRPDPRIHGPGPYPCICAVYGGPHVQRVSRSWSLCSDMRAQRLRSLGFCVLKCDNRGSSRRGMAFESAIAKRLGRLEVLDQVAAVRQLVVRGIVDPNRVGVYGWSYGGYLAAMCLCRAPDVFHVAVAGAPVTSWDGYDTHYTERYMGLPADNPSGYREAAVFDHIPNMRGKLLIVHGLIDENVHFRHTSRLINKLISAGKDYDLLIFPEERHSPRRLRDRIYMEQRIGDYFLRHLGMNANPSAFDLVTASMGQRASSVPGLRHMAGRL